MKVKTSYIIPTTETPKNGNGHSNGHGNGLIGFPSWLLKLARRLSILPHGRYQLILTIDRDCDWTVIELGKVERSSNSD